MIIDHPSSHILRVFDSLSILPLPSLFNSILCDCTFTMLKAVDPLSDEFLAIRPIIINESHVIIILEKIMQYL